MRIATPTLLIAALLSSLPVTAKQSQERAALQEKRPPQVLVLLGEWFGDAWFDLEKELNARGWEFKKAGPDAEFRGCYKKERDVLLKSDILIQDLHDFSGYDCLIIPSGPQFRKFNANPAVLQFVRESHRAGLLIASFCTGNRVVKEAGLIDFPPGPKLFPAEPALVGERIILGPRGGGPPPGDGYKSAPVKKICDIIETTLFNSRSSTGGKKEHE